MTQFDSVLLTYAQSGLRTIEDWNSRGRDIVTGAEPRVNTPHRGADLPLYSHDQTHVHVRTQRPEGDLPTVTT